MTHAHTHTDSARVRRGASEHLEHLERERPRSSTTHTPHATQPRTREHRHAATPTRTRCATRMTTRRRPSTRASGLALSRPAKPRVPSRKADDHAMRTRCLGTTTPCFQHASRACPVSVPPPPRAARPRAFPLTWRSLPCAHPRARAAYPRPLEPHHNLATQTSFAPPSPWW